MFATNLKQRQSVQKWRKENTVRVREYKRNYYRDNANQRIKNNAAAKVRHAILGTVKKCRSDLTGCTNEFLRKHLESLFDDKMSWDNYGKYGWVIDHIRAASLYDLTNESELKKCFSFHNLQPLWHVDNHKKYNKVV